MAQTPASLPLIDNKKIPYIDNLRIALACLPTVVHTMGAYTPTQFSWYDHEPTKNALAAVLLGCMITILSVFSMGLYFSIAGHFMPASYDKRGPRKFTLERLRRLGLPLLFNFVVISPILEYFVEREKAQGPIRPGLHISYFPVSFFNFGVTWFLALLIIFSLVYVLVRLTTKLSLPTWRAPRLGGVLLSGLVLGLISFVVRIEFPWNKPQMPTCFMYGVFPQFIAMFIFGLIAYKNNWLPALSFKDGKRAGWIALAVGPPGFIAILIVGGFILKTPEPDYYGGFKWMSLVVAIWGEITAICVSFFLLTWFKHRINHQSPLLTQLTRISFSVYIFHTVFLLALSHLLRPWAVDGAWKILVVMPATLFLSFALAQILSKIPGVNKVF